MFSCTEDAERHINPVKEEMSRCVKFEHKLLNLVGMKKDLDYSIYDVDFPMEDNTIGHIHTIESGFKNKPVLVLVHGFGSGAVFYFKVIAELRQHYHIYCLDLFGFCSSGRPNFDNHTAEQVCQTHAHVFEQWRKNLKITDFVLAGHSLGGYLVHQWVKLKNPPIKALYLLSPAGFTNKTDDEILGLNPGFFDKMKFKTFNYFMHEKNINPFNLLPFKETVLKKKFSGERINLGELEAKYASKYLAAALKQKTSGEVIVGKVLRFARYSNQPISEWLKSRKDKDPLTVPVIVLYGEKDWMDFNHSLKINKEWKLGTHIAFINDCDHQIILQNPKGLVERMVKDLKEDFEHM